MAIVFVNAVAAKEGGALAILSQFITHADRDNHYHFFISDLSLIKEGVEESCFSFHQIGAIGGFLRLMWDYFGLFLWSIRRKVYPDVIVSLQNTPVAMFGAAKQIVYLHQAIPITSGDWSPLKKDERAFWFYKKVYPFFMRGFSKKKNEYVCQAQWMRPLYARLLGVGIDRVHAFVPDPGIDLAGLSACDDEAGRYLFVYPAGPFTYKNHLVIVEAVELIRERSPEIYNKLQLHFTIDAQSSPFVAAMIERRGLQGAFSLRGYLDHASLMRLFSVCRGLLFPSKIETIGLPLIEAAALGRPILVSDLDYAREALEGYKGAVFVLSDDAEAWADRIIEMARSVSGFEPLVQNKVNGWRAFFDFLKSVSGH